MITALKIGASPYTGTLWLDKDEDLQLGADTAYNTINIALSDKVLQKVPSVSNSSDTGVGAVYTINQIPASYWDDNYLILGSLCTSVTDSTDSSGSQSSHTLSIFDGCFACNDCQTIAQLQQDIQNLQIWINGLKDCNLYYQPAASRLWDAMVQKKITQAATCAVDTSTLVDRQEDFGQAIKLLYQFKALTAMWNYLIRARSLLAQILQAPQDYGGFVVQTKRDINACQLQTSSTTKLTIDITLQSGQLGDYLDSIGGGMGLFVSRVAQNTYIQPQGGTILDTKQVELLNGHPHIRAQFTFSPLATCDTVLSGSLKVLPVIYIKGQDYQQDGGDTYTAPSDALTAVTLTQWIIMRPKATTVSEAQQKAMNRWYIQVTWSNSSLGESVSQDYYYMAAFNKRPQLSDSGSDTSNAFSPSNFDWYTSDDQGNIIDWGYFE